MRDQPPAEAPTPGERRLDRPPSDRYRTADAAPTTEAGASPADGASGVPARGIAAAVVTGILGAVAIVVVGGVILVPEGLVVVAGIVGSAIALALRVGAGRSIAGRRRIVVAVVLALAAVALGQLGLWLYGRAEGGVLAPIDYLWEVFGLLVPLQFAAAALGAWLVAR